MKDTENNEKKTLLRFHEIKSSLFLLRLSKIDKPYVNLKKEGGGKLMLIK